MFPFKELWIERKLNYASWILSENKHCFCFSHRKNWAMICPHLIKIHFLSFLWGLHCHLVYFIFFHFRCVSLRASCYTAPNFSMLFSNNTTADLHQPSCSLLGCLLIYICSQSPPSQVVDFGLNHCWFLLAFII